MTVAKEQAQALLDSIMEKHDKDSQGVIEALADYAHDAWSGWMAWLFVKSDYSPVTGEVTIPADLVTRWRRQAVTPYAELPIEEQHSDRIEAARMMIVIVHAWQNKEEPRE